MYHANKVYDNMLSAQQALAKVLSCTIARVKEAGLGPMKDVNNEKIPGQYAAWITVYCLGA